MNKHKGFTIIELLVVVAIIGVLSSVILASIKSAREKNADAAAKANFQQISPQAELYYTDNGYSFAGMCDLGAHGATGVKSVAEIVAGAAKAENFTSFGVNNSPAASTTTVTCNNTDSAWAVEIPQKNKDIGGSGLSAMYCVDSAGFAGYRATSMGATVNCPAS